MTPALSHMPAPQASGARAPAIASRASERLASLLAGRLEAPGGPHRRKSIASDLAPSPAERALLAARARDLEGALAPIDPDVARRAVAALRAAGFAMPGDGDTAHLMLVLYVKALEGFPEWAVSEACARVLRGEAEIDPAYAPTAPQLATLCRRIVEPFRVEQARIAEILDAQVYPVASAAERAAMAEAFARLSQEVMAAAEPRRAPA